MKRLFSLVLMSFSTVFIAMNETSCFCQKVINNRQKKKDISTMTFTKSTATTNDKLYDLVYEQIGNKATPIATISDIKNDTSLIIKIQDETSADISYDTNPTHQATYNILITVQSSDIYFIAMNQTTFTIEVDPGGKTDLSTYTFTKIYATNGAEIFSSIAEQLAVEGGTTIANINQDIKDGNIIITFTDSASNQITNTSTTYTDGNCTINLQILGSDIYFQQLAAKDYPVVAANVVDISLKTFQDVSCTLNSELFTNVRTQIGSWAIPTVTESQIKADSSITITIYNFSGAPIEDNGSNVSHGTTYQVKIKVDADDLYFQPMGDTNYDINIK